MSTDLGAVFDAHVGAEFEQQDVDATMATMSADPYVWHVPTLAGGDGFGGVREFYSSSFVGKWPTDTKVQQVARTVGDRRVVQELIVSFTHDVEFELMLRGIPPTGRLIEVPVVVVMGVDDAGKVAYEHIYWDQATVLVQAGLIDPAQVPACGAEQVSELLKRARR